MRAPLLAVVALSVSAIAHASGNGVRGLEGNVFSLEHDMQQEVKEKTGERWSPPEISIGNVYSSPSLPSIPVSLPPLPAPVVAPPSHYSGKSPSYPPQSYTHSPENSKLDKEPKGKIDDSPPRDDLNKKLKKSKKSAPPISKGKGKGVVGSGKYSGKRKGSASGSGSGSGKRKGKGIGNGSSKVAKGKGKGVGSGKFSKGKGKGKGGSNPGMGCTSAVADEILAQVDGVVTKNPSWCCSKYDVPTAVFITHAEPNSNTASGFERFWDAIYIEVEQVTDQAGICFVFTGYDPTTANARNLSDVLIETNTVTSEIPQVPVIMTTDPTDSVDLIDEIRAISNSTTGPSIGVFNAGYNNIIIESIVSGMERIPFVGVIDDTSYGTEAAAATKTLLNGTTAVPLCFNARIGSLDFIGERCATYYSAVTDVAVDPPTGVNCSMDSTADDLVPSLVNGKINAVFAHVDCCSVVAQAAATVRSMGQSIVVGCMDEDTSTGGVDFVTGPPLRLQGYSAATWASFPVIQAMQGRDGRAEQYFPSLESLVNTAVMNTFIVESI